MPNFDVHLSSVTENLRAYESIDAECIRSRSIVLFYAGMHIIEAVAAKRDDSHFEHHSSRARYMKEHHRAEAKHYTNLYDLGYQARYYPHRLVIKRPDALDEQYRKKIIDNCLIPWASRVLSIAELREQVLAASILS